MTYKQLEDCKKDLIDNNIYWVKLRFQRWQPALWISDKESMKLLIGGYKKLHELSELEITPLHHRYNKSI